MELVVRKERAVVALDAVRLAYEELETGDFVVRQRVLRRRAVRLPGRHETVEARRPVSDAPLVGRDSLAEIDEHGGDVISLGGRQALPCRARLRIGDRSRFLG